METQMFVAFVILSGLIYNWYQSTGLQILL